jgi:hypothetical protein
VETFVAVVSRHGKPEAVHLFETEAEAKRFAVELSSRESWQERPRHTHDHGDHAHDNYWLGEWADEDGCSVVFGLAAEGAAHPHHSH